MFSTYRQMPTPELPCVWGPGVHLRALVRQHDSGISDLNFGMHNASTRAIQPHELRVTERHLVELDHPDSGFAQCGAVRFWFVDGKSTEFSFPALAELKTVVGLFGATGILEDSLHLGN